MTCCVSSKRTQRRGRRWWSRTSRRRESSPVTEPSPSTRRRCGGWSRPTWRSRLRTSPERPSRRPQELWRRCEVVRAPKGSSHVYNSPNSQVTHRTFSRTRNDVTNHICTHLLQTLYCQRSSTCLLQSFSTDMHSLPRHSLSAGWSRAGCQ